MHAISSIPFIILITHYLPDFLTGSRLIAVFVITNTLLSIVVFFEWIRNSKNKYTYIAILSVWYVFITLMAIFAQQFHDLPRISSIVLTFTEGLGTPLKSAYLLIPKKLILISVICLAVSGYFQFSGPLISRSLWKQAIILRSMLLIFILIYRPISLTRVHANWLNDSVRKYGLLVSWGIDFGDVIFLRSKEVEITQLESNQKELPIQPIRSSTHAKHILAIQVESLDIGTIWLDSQGIPVTPHLRDWSSQGNFLTLQANYGLSGSSGSDFQFLTGLRPLLSYPVYKSLALGQLETLPRKIQMAGGKLRVYHNNTARFWNRGNAYRQLGVSNFYSMDSIPMKHASKWGLTDSDVIDEILAHARGTSAQDRFFGFWITMSSHSPFDLVKEARPGPDIQENYIHTFKYVDSELGRLIEQWPLDDTIFIFYADHPSQMRKILWTPDQDQLRVPCIMFYLKNKSINKVDITGTNEEHLEIASLSEFYLNISKLN